MHKDAETQRIPELLNQFKKVGLKGLSGIKLLDRKDTKYVTHIRNITSLLNDLKKDYRVLEINGNSVFRCRTEYFYTDSFFLYLQHHNDKLNRHKIRTRTYLDSGTSFFEIKLKNNKGRTIKKRKKIKKGDGGMKELVKNCTGKYLSKGFPELKSIIRINYKRITLVNPKLKEWITLDFDIVFSNPEQTYGYKNLLIIEIFSSSTILRGVPASSILITFLMPLLTSL